jgi:hypothetical protein
MATLTKVLLSASSEGRSIDITATAGVGGVLVHTPHSTTTTIDEVWVRAHNGTTKTLDLVLEWGASATANQIITTLAPKDGLNDICLGQPILGQSAGSAAVRAFIANSSGSASQSVIAVYGWVNRFEV